MDKLSSTNKNSKFELTPAFKDIIIIFVAFALVFILSYYFNLFVFLLELFKRNPKAMSWVDEIITCLLTLSIGLAIFSWRRWLELKKETAQRIRLQAELITMAETKAQTADIICKELRSEIDYHRKINK